MQEYKGEKDFESIKNAIIAMEDGKASSEHFVGLFEDFQMQPINTIDDFISKNKQHIKTNYKITEYNEKQKINEGNELKNKIQDLNTERQMYTMLLPIQAINIHHNHLYNFFSKLSAIYEINQSNISNGNPLAPYPAIDFIIDIKATLALNLKYIHNTDNFSIEKWKNNWQEVKSPSQKA